MRKWVKIIIWILIILYVIMFFVNKSNINKNTDPVFYFSKQIANDGGSTIYNVLLYKIIKTYIMIMLYMNWGILC